MNTSKPPRFRTVLGTTLLTFFISGVGGVLLSQYTLRPKPAVIIRSIGFDGDQDLIEVPDALTKSSEESGWCDAFKKFESYGHLEREYRTLLRVRQHLRGGIAQVEPWLKEKSAWTGEPPVKITFEDLMSCPLTQNAIIGSLLSGSALRSEIQQPPIPLDQLEKLDAITDVSRQKNGYALYLRKKNVLFPLKESANKLQSSAVEQMARSFAQGCAKNIHNYHQQFVTIAYYDLERIERTVQQLEAVLLPASHVFITASLV